MVLERDITAEITAWLKKQKECWYYKITAKPAKVKEGSFARQRTGIPDLCVVYQGKTIWLEVKRPGNYLSKTQKEEIARMQLAGGLVYMVRSLDEVKRALGVEE